MAALTINEAASATGWSARMLRYVEQLGLVEPSRSAAGYRLYGPAQLHSLRTLRSLLDEHGLELGDVATAQRLRQQPATAQALDRWLAAQVAVLAVAPLVPPDAPASALPSLDGDWLAFEQHKHQHLLHP